MRKLLLHRSVAACLLWAGMSNGWCQTAMPSGSSVNATTNAQAASSPYRSAGVDLAALRVIAVDALRIAETGDLSAARKRIDDLERAWDRETPGMKVAAPERWRALDAALDRAERELRFWRARRTDSIAALQELVRTFDSAP